MRIGIFSFIVFIFFSHNANANCKDVLNEVLYDSVCTKIKTYKSKVLSDKPILLVALHGDTAPWSFSDEQYSFAKRVANNNANVVAVGMLRPGYIDVDKRQSDGIQGEGVGDNYDKQRVEQISNAIHSLKKQYHAYKVILVGQSGGAATAANLIAYYPNLVDHALLIACPCDIDFWRKSMFELTKKDVFKGNLNKVSPIDMVEQVSNKISITLLAGDKDMITPPHLIRRYQSALLKAKKDVKLRIIEGDHEIFLSKDAVSSALEIIMSI